MSTLFEPEAAARVPLEPVLIVQRRDHPFQKREVSETTGKPKRGCGVCFAAKASMVHVGAPASFNATGSGSNRFAWMNLKQAWQSALLQLLRDSELPTDLSHVMVEARICFPTRARRDQGNFRGVIEKSLGDALQEGGYIPDDDWDHYEFGGLQKTYAKGESWTEFMIFPSR